ncbi:MAG: hypothetical protein F4X65_10395 [Chloroflexi bacterium]|nr:hypothetical protein [Chloroflexota bacterium]
MTLPPCRRNWTRTPFHRRRNQAGPIWKCSSVGSGNGSIEVVGTWCQEVAKSGLQQFQPIARSFGRAYEAMNLALNTPRSTRYFEGQVMRVKLVKRNGFGRTNLALLF